MSEETVADPPPSRAAVETGRSRVAAALAFLSVSRTGAVVGVALVAYFVFVIPSELAALFGATMVGAALVGIVPLVVVYAVIRSPV